jgi:thiamine biosynthesis lipoprotein
MKLIFTSLIAFCLALLIACDQPGAPATEAKFYAFGTEIDISLWGVDIETANEMVTILEAGFSNINDTWHAWQPSTLSEINQAISESRPIPIEPNVEALIRQAKQLAQQSDHLFNPAAGKLFELWGFHQDDWFISHSPPSAADIQTWLNAKPTMDNIYLDNGKLWCDNPSVKLGFGAFAKGHAVNIAMNILKEQGIGNAIVNIGGDLQAIGQHGNRPWNIGIRHPRQPGMIASIALREGESVFTSGDYERFFEYNGSRYAHILDPRIGAPATQAQSVTVLHHNPVEADAAATALFVAGNDWPKIAIAMEVNSVMVIRENGHLEMSPKMAQRIQLMEKDHVITIRKLF